ncbi:MAG: hypothetical protein IKF52_06090 [Clostridia bacterium]|nr:hypothetical protein [Clostridia bacterium]
MKFLERLKKSGFSTIISTSHYYEGYFEEDEENRLKKIEKLNKVSDNLEIKVGSEIFCSPDIVKFLNEKKSSTLAGSRYVLFEIPFTNNVSFFDRMIDSLRRNGFLPVIAHPERYDIVIDNPKIVEEWHKRGIYIQCNYESITGKYGKESEEVIKLLLRHRLVDFLGSDVHRPGTYKRIKFSVEKIKKIIDDDYFEVLSNRNEEKVLKNEKIEIEECEEIRKTIFGKYK